MAEGKKTFIFYSDWINMVREMPNEEAGILLKHVLSYVNDENPTTDNPLVKMAFGHMKPMLKKDLERWEVIREKRRKAGAKGGKQTQANAKQMLNDAKQVQAVNDNVNVISINTYSYKEFLEDWNTQRNKHAGKPSHMNRLSYEEKEMFTELCNDLENPKKEINDALIGFFKQGTYVNGMDLSLNVKHFLKSYTTYYQAYHDKNPNVWGKNE